jgi:hypothetical protein
VEEWIGVGVREMLTRRRPLPGWQRVLGSILAIVGVLLTIIGLPSIPDDLARWPAILASIGDFVRGVQDAAAPYSGDVVRLVVLVVAVLFLGWLNLPVEQAVALAPTPEPTKPPPQAAPTRARPAGDRVSVHRLVWADTDRAKPTPKPPDDGGLAMRAAQAGVTQATQARREMNETLPARAQPPSLPQRLSGLSGGELGTYGWRMLTDRQKLLDEGRSHKAQLNRSASLVASDEKGWRQRIDQWEQKIVDWSNEWGWAPEEEIRQAFYDGETLVDPTTRPRPEWRARVAGRIDGGLGWLDAHSVTVEQVGLHTE